ncbi:MAG TPA: DUF4167 domain-containing protein [Parvularculaceae bacterium]|nr:DUF4167 domain-containing protein [Parvularculaceae bacterium]
MKRGRNQRRRQGMNINRALDSNGPDVRIRGTANQIYDKYQALARDASSSGDRVKAENYLQHAEHYFRMIRALQPAQPPQNDGVDIEGDQPSIDGERSPRREDGAGEARGQAEGNGEGETNRDERREEARPNGSGVHAGEDGGMAGNNSGDFRRRRRRPRREPQGGGAFADDHDDDETDSAETTAS